MRELYKECTATGRILTIFLAALHTAQVCHTTTRCMLFPDLFCIMPVNKEIYNKLRPPLIGKSLRTRKCTNIPRVCRVHLVHIRAQISLYQISLYQMHGCTIRSPQW